MAIGYVASNKWLSFNDSGPTTSLANGVFAVSVSAGSLLVAVAQWFTTDETQTFSDSLNGTWTTAVQKFDTSGALGSGIAIGYFKNSAAGACTVSVSSASSVHRSLDIVELTGADTSSQPDGTPVGAEDPNASAQVDAGTITTAGAGIIIAASAGSGWTTPAADTNFTLQTSRTPTGCYLMGIEDYITTAAQTNIHAQFNNNNNFWVAVGAAFKAASGGGGSSPVIGRRIYVMP